LKLRNIKEIRVKEYKGNINLIGEINKLKNRLKEKEN
jgi:hypothetical protein